jgi:hypothetical protein
MYGGKAFYGKDYHNKLFLCQTTKGRIEIFDRWKVGKMQHLCVLYDNYVM